MYQIIDLQMYSVAPKDFIPVLQDRLAEARRGLPVKTQGYEWELASTHRDYGTIFAIFEERAR